MKLKFTTIALTLLFFILINLFYNKVAAQAPSQNTYASYDTDKNDTITPAEYIHALSVITTITNDNKFFTRPSDTTAAFPLGISKKLNNGKQYAIFIDSAHYNDNATLSMYTEFVLPNTDMRLIFGVKNIAFNNTSLKFTSTTRLQLLRSEQIKISDNVVLELAANGKNFVDWDCNGFKAVNLEGTFKFKKTFLKPANTTNPNATVNATFKIYATDFSNILASVSITPFKVDALTDFIFEVDEAVVDMSDDVNPQGMHLTSIEKDDYGGNDNLWRGFYLQKLKVTLPPLFSKQNGSRPVISATNLRIDDYGVTGLFAADSILKLGDADAGGWPISMDHFELQLVHSKVKGGGIGGDLNVGFLGDQPLRYLARVTDKDGSTWYNFNVSLQDNVKFKTFLGDVTLNSGSIITLDKVNDSIVGKAILHGRVDIAQKLLIAPGIKFQQLELSTQKPYVRGGVFSVDGNINCKINGYGLQFQNLTFGIMKGSLTLSSNVILDLMNTGDNGFSAEAQVNVSAKQEETKYTTYIGKQPVEKTRVKWKFDKVRVPAIGIDVSVSAFTLKGIIRIFEDDPVYGNGFQGSLSVKVPALPQNLLANAYFGTKTDNLGSFKYYHVDVKVPMGPTGVPLFPGIGLYAITGGISYRMERPNDFDPFKVALDNQAKVYANMADTTMNNTETMEGKEKMLTPFLTYVPSRASGYGFLAGVTIATMGTTSLINADLMFEVMLRHNGGLRYVQFDGSMFAAAPFKLRGKMFPKDETGSAPIFIQAKIRYDNDAHSLHGSCKTYINTPGNVLKGIGPNGLVGEVQFHFDRHDWWFYIGRPTEMVGLSIMDLAQVKTYFQVGTKTEDMPPIPAEVGNILNETNLNFMDKENAMSTGKGIGFGVHFRIAKGVGSKEDSKSFIYASLKIGAGADILLRDYGNVRCKGSGELGIKGWYASGQAYAFVEGRVGIRVKVMKVKREFDIAYLAAAAVLQAKLPNPSWFRGILGVKYSILGGLIKGNAKLKFELGSQCEMISDKEIEIQIIKDFLPDSNATDVSVFASPQASFNYAIEKPFEMMNNEDVVTTYRIKLDAFKILSNNQPLQGQVNLTEAKDAVSFTGVEVLPPNSTVKASVVVGVEKQTGGSWVKVMENGSPMMEAKSIAFNTGDAPNKIEAGNVAYSYPIHKQYNFFSKETGTGYLALKIGQAYLFRPSSGSGDNIIDWKFAAHFESNDGEAFDTPLSYDSAKRTVIFNIPEGMKNSTVYNMGIVKTPLNGGNAANNTQQTTTTTIEEEGDTTSVTTNSLRGMALSENAILVYQLAFRSSRFNSFKEKILAQRGAQDLFDISNNVQPIIGKRYDSDEAYDRFDLEGTTSIAVRPLVQVAASEDNEWLQTKVSPLLYDPYGTFNSLQIGLDRDTSIFGLKPLRAMEIYNNDVAGSFELTDGEMGEVIVPGKTSRVRYMYFINHFSNIDHNYMRRKAVEKFIDGGTGSPEPVRALILNTFPEMPAGKTYNIKMQYVLPGINTVSSVVDDVITFY
jgi:hypothetical protein